MLDAPFAHVATCSASVGCIVTPYIYMAASKGSKETVLLVIVVQVGSNPELRDRLERAVTLILQSPTLREDLERGRQRPK